MEQNAITPDDEIIDLDALQAEFDAELPKVRFTPSTVDDGADVLAPERGVPATPTPPGAPDRVPAAEAQAQSSPPASKPATAEGDTLEDRIRRLEAQTEKAQLDAELARKGQAAADRKVAALAEARQLELNRQAELRMQGQLTQQELDRGQQLTDAWIQRREFEARELEARQEAERLAAMHADRAAQDEALQEFNRQALPLAREMILLGLDPAAKSNTNPENPEELLYEALLREALNDPERQEDIALTWEIQDPEVQQRLTRRVYNGARAAVAARLGAVANAQGTVASGRERVAALQAARVTSPGSSGGGEDPFNNMHPDDMWQYIQWKNEMPAQAQ